MSGAQTVPSPLVVLATHNQGKLRELRELLRGQVPGLDVDTQVVDAATAGAADVLEDGITFAQNALKKARAVAEQTGFASAAHFRRVFREVMGTGPLQYRKGHKK